MSSSEHDDLPSSPLRAAEKSSPLRDEPSSPLCPSSPIVEPQSSPLHYASSSSQCDSPSSKRRRTHSPTGKVLRELCVFVTLCYAAASSFNMKLHLQQVAYEPMYWPDGFEEAGNASVDDYISGPEEPLQSPHSTCENGDGVAEAGMY